MNPGDRVRLKKSVPAELMDVTCRWYKILPGTEATIESASAQTVAWWCSVDGIRNTAILIPEMHLEAVEQPQPSKVCVCTTPQLALAGCICGAFQSERAKK